MSEMPEELRRRAGLTPVPDVKRHGLVPSLAEVIQAGEVFARDGGGALYRYEAGVYREGAEELVQAESKRLLGAWGLEKKWSSHKAHEVVRYILADCPVLWERPPEDRVNVLNGILDTRTEELEPHSPAWLSPVQIPVMYDPEAECPAWDRFVGQVFPEDAQELAFEIPGWLMVPDTSIQSAVLLTGEGANGKSVFLSALEAFLGDRNSSAVSLQKLESDRFSVSRLVGKLANVCADLPSEHLSGSSMFKAITGGDTLLAERKYGTSFELRPCARLIFSANLPPRSGDSTHAFFRRWTVIPFDRTFEPHEQRPRAELDAELQDPRELSGVLNRALVGLLKVRARNRLSQPESVKEALEEFRATTDPLSTWLDRNTIEHPNAMVAQKELAAAYNAHCEENGSPGMSAQSFGKAISRARPDVLKSQRHYKGYPNVRVFSGIGLRDDEARGSWEESP